MSGENALEFLSVRRGGPGTRTRAMNGLRVPRWRVWAPVSKAAALFLLPTPLVFAALAALVTGDAGRLAVIISALLCFWGAGVLSWRALIAQARYRLGDSAELPAVPLKLVSAIATASGAATAAIAGGHTWGGAAAYAALGGAGYLAFYGLDLRPRRITVAAVQGVDTTSISDQLEQALQRLRRIEAASRAVAVPEFRHRLDRIISIGRSIIGEIERDPRHASRARRFLHIYLDSTERVTEEYARTHRRIANDALEQSFSQLLIEMENTFAQQHRKLLESDVLSLDVEIEVLNARLKREGVGASLERRDD